MISLFSIAFSSRFLFFFFFSLFFAHADLFILADALHIFFHAFFWCRRHHAAFDADALSHALSSALFAVMIVWLSLRGSPTSPFAIDAARCLFHFRRRRFRRRLYFSMLSPDLFDADAFSMPPWCFDIDAFRRFIQLRFIG